MPGPADVLLAIEVADPLLATDRSVKLRLYAEVMIPEVWILNLAGATIEQWSDPDGRSYRVVRRYGRDERLIVASNLALVISTTAILG